MVTGTVIAQSELDSIRECLRTNEVSDEQQRRIQLQKKSKARADTWTNTLVGSRRKKAQMRLEELEKQEKARQAIDEEEARYQLEERKAVINFANSVIFDEGDRVKSFKSRMMHSDVIAEREAQIELKEELQKLELLRDERYLEMDRQNYRKMLERELTEKRDLENRIKEQSAAQAEQRAKKAASAKAAAEQLQCEGMIIRQKAQEDLASEAKLAAQRRKQARDTAMAALKASEYSKEIIRGEQLRAEKEDEHIAEYAAQKERMLQLRKAKESEIKAVKLAARQKMIDQQAKALAAMQSNEEARVQSQVEEKEAAKEKERLKKEENLAQMARDIDRSRKSQIKRKNMERDCDLAEEAEVALFWKEYQAKLEHEEEGDKMMRRREAEALAQAQLKQVAVKKRREREAKRIEDKTAAKAKMKVDSENVEFHQFAEEVIEEYARDGKNIIPLVKNLQEFRKGGLQ